MSAKLEEGESQSKRAALPRSDKKSSLQADPGNLKAGHCRDISAKRPEDEYSVTVRGLLTVPGQVVVVDNNNKMLKLFNDSGAFLSSTALKDFTFGITRVSDDTFATCGDGNKVYIWNIHGQTITFSDITYPVDYITAYGIHYNGTYFCVLHYYEKVITILDKHGEEVRRIHLNDAFGKEILLGFSIYVDQHSHTIYLPCWGDNCGVLCVSVEGEPLWFTPLSTDMQGITEIRGVLCVCNPQDSCLHLLSKAGKLEGKLMEEKDVDRKPKDIYYDDQNEKLYVGSYNHVISVYSII